MSYRIMLIFAFFFSVQLSANNVINNINDTQPYSNYIRVQLDDPVLPNSSIGRKIKVTVQQDMYNSSSTFILIPVYTTISCIHQSSMHVEGEYNIVYINCNHMSLSNGTEIHFKGSVYSGINKEGLLTDKNVTVQQNTPAFVRIESALTITKTETKN